jgi:hypothetical protein
LFGQTVGLLGLVVIRHGQLLTFDAGELRAENENPSAERRGKIWFA